MPGSNQRVRRWRRAIPEQSARDGEQGAFDEELPEDAKLPGADGDADGDLASPSGAACEQHVGDVGTGDQEYESDGARRSRERRAHVVGAGDYEDGLDAGGDPVGFGILRARARDGVELGAGGRRFSLGARRPNIMRSRWSRFSERVAMSGVQRSVSSGKRCRAA